MLTYQDKENLQRLGAFMLLLEKPDEVKAMVKSAQDTLSALDAANKKFEAIQSVEKAQAALAVEKTTFAETQKRERASIADLMKKAQETVAAADKQAASAQATIAKGQKQLQEEKAALALKEKELKVQALKIAEEQSRLAAGFAEILAREAALKTKEEALRNALKGG